MKPTTFFFMFTYAFMSSVALVMLRSSLPSAISIFKGQGGDKSSLVLFAAGMAMYVLTLLMWLYLIANNELALMYPIAVAFVTVFTFIGSVFVLHERVTWLHVAGAGVVVAGVFLLYYASTNNSAASLG